MITRCLFLLSVNLAVTSCGYLFANSVKPATPPPSECTDGSTPVDLVCNNEHRVFLRNTHLDTANFSVVAGATSGLNGADLLCTSGASLGSLTKTYRAMLSTATVDAIDRLNINGEIYVFSSSDRASGRLVANNKSDLFDGIINTPIKFDSNHNSVSAPFAATGSSNLGIKTAFHCGSWGGLGFIQPGTSFGEVGVVNRWFGGVDMIATCSNPLEGFIHIYCISQ